MPAAPTPRLPSLAEAAAYTPQQIVGLAEQVVGLTDQVAGLKHQLDWFRRQLFGQTSERRLPEPPATQLSLGELFQPLPQQAPPAKPVAAHTRRPVRPTQDDRADALPFFDRERVPVEVIELAPSEIDGLAPDQYELDRLQGQLPAGAASWQLCGIALPAPAHQTARHSTTELPCGTGRGDRRESCRRQFPGRTVERLMRRLGLRRHARQAG